MKSAATDFVSPMMAALLVPETKRVGNPRSEDATEDILMMDPPPRAIIFGKKARIMRNRLRTLSSIVKLQSSSLHSRIVP